MSFCFAMIRLYSRLYCCMWFCFAMIRLHSRLVACDFVLPPYNFTADWLHVTLFCHAMSMADWLFNIKLLTLIVASRIFSPSMKICRLSGVTFTSTDSEEKGNNVIREPNFQTIRGRFNISSSTHQKQAQTRKTCPVTSNIVIFDVIVVAVGGRHV